MKKFVRMIWMVCGFLCFGLGSIGVVVPCIPTVPFYLGCVFCFGKGSTKLHDWFLQTKLYKKHLESFHKEQALSLKTKLMIMCSVTLLMGFGFVMMDQAKIARIILVIVYLFHLYYFVFKIKTVKGEQV